MTASRWLSTVIGLFALTACTNEKIVFKTREPFNPPAATARVWLGCDTGQKARRLQVDPGSGLAAGIDLVDHLERDNHLCRFEIHGLVAPHASRR